MAVYSSPLWLYKVVKCSYILILLIIMNKLRKVLITGANRGLGFKLAETLSPK